MSQDVFQLHMDAILEQCPGVIGIHNDMVIFGVDQEDHDANLINLLKRLPEGGIGTKQPRSWNFEERESHSLGQSTAHRACIQTPRRSKGSQK